MNMFSPHQQKPSPEATRQPGSKRALPGIGSILWRSRLGPAFWTIASLISLTVNVILIIILILVGKQVFALKDMVSDQLVSGLHTNFIKMDQARITTTVEVNDTIPVMFDLPVQTETRVILTKNTRIKGATVNLHTGGLSITNAPANILLPAGTELPIALNIVVPVSTTVPVKLTVPVDIPLNQTELHEPFVGLQNVISPYDHLLSSLPDSWDQTPACQSGLDFLCNWLMDEKR